VYGVEDWRVMTDVERAVLDADLVIGAVLVPGAKAPTLISDELVSRMRPGSVLVDIAVDQGGCFESSRPTTHSDPTFTVGNSVFYCVANMPGAVPHTSTYALTNVTMPYALELANRGLHVDTKPPKIAYRETIQLTADGHHRHKKQTGGAGQFGEVFLRAEPLPEDSPHRRSNGGAGLEIVNEVFGGTIPGQFIPAVEKGIHDVMEAGAVAGFPLQDVRVAITDGKHHPVDSKEVAFRTAGKFAFKDAILKAKPVLLEPVVHMEVTVPEDKMGTITGDLSGKRGRIQGTDVLAGGVAVVKAQAPLAEVMQYQSQLKSVTGGQGSFVMEFSHYEPVPPQVQKNIEAQYKPHPEEE